MGRKGGIINRPLVKEIILQCTSALNIRKYIHCEWNLTPALSLACKQYVWSERPKEIRADETTLYSRQH